MGTHSFTLNNVIPKVYFTLDSITYSKALSQCITMAMKRESSHLIHNSQLIERR